MAQPNLAPPYMAPPYMVLFYMVRCQYNLDNSTYEDIWHNHPAQGNGSVECFFNAIPLSQLGIQFRDLSEYGKISEESPDRLNITLCHKHPEMLLSVIKQAWVTKYQDMGTPCVMVFSPMRPFRPTYLFISRLYPTAFNNMEPEQPEQLERAFKPNTNFFSELVDQLSPHGMIFPAGYMNVARRYQGYPEYQPAMHNQGHRSGEAPVFRPGPQGPGPRASGLQTPTPPRGTRTYQHNRGRGSRGEGHRERGSNEGQQDKGDDQSRLYNPKKDVGPQGGGGQGIKEPREDATKDDAADSRDKKKQKVAGPWRGDP
ncbi:hypothetical protein F4677DRAFT_442229 [Hypoxylon crocopeplum]|nr:hypothetical protein F4677DRAFT_442229 [Hypoxylon crocopeplum]